MESEACPICWRDFGAEAVPVCLSCGHSFCQDCSAHLRTCSLCRQRISNTFQRKPNFALLSAIEKASRRQEMPQTSQATQTEPDIIQLITQPRSRARQPAVSVLEGKSMLVQVRRTGIQLEFK
jgi:uncharacterized UBP type Zn finger protein